MHFQDYVCKRLQLCSLTKNVNQLKTITKAARLSRGRTAVNVYILGHGKKGWDFHPHILKEIDFCNGDFSYRFYNVNVGDFNPPVLP